MHQGFNKLRRRVVDRGLCTGCGTCVGICPERCLELYYEDGEPMPREKPGCISCGICIEACPGEDIPFPALERFVFGRIRSKDEQLGIFRNAYAAWAAEDDVRNSGSDGGVGTALLMAALETKLIDCAIVADYSAVDPWRAIAVLATKPDELRKAAISKYMLLSPGSLLGLAAKYDKIGIIASPCVIHALRKVQMKGLAPRLSRKLVFQLGLYCGAQPYFEGTRHLLSEYLRIPDLKNVTRLQYRAGTYPGNLVVETADGKRSEIPGAEYKLQFLIFYNRDRCQMCVDYASELADISVGAYYPLPGEPKEAERKTATVVRTEKGQDLLKLAKESHYICGDEVSYSDLFLHGTAGFEIKKHAAAFRQKQRRHFGWPTPNFHYCPSHEPFPRSFSAGRHAYTSPLLKVKNTVG